MAKTKNERILLLSKCAVWDSKKSKFINGQKASRLISSLRIETLLRKIPLVGLLLSQRYQQVNTRYKFSGIINKSLFAGDKYIHEMHLRELGFTYSACGPFIKSKERIQKFKETEDSRYIYQNELDKGYCQHDMVYGDFNDLTRRTTSDKVLCDNAFNAFLKNCTNQLLESLENEKYAHLLKTISGVLILPVCNW